MRESNIEINSTDRNGHNLKITVEGVDDFGGLDLHVKATRVFLYIPPKKGGLRDFRKNKSPLNREWVLPYSRKAPDCGRSLLK